MNEVAQRCVASLVKAGHFVVQRTVSRLYLIFAGALCCLGTAALGQAAPVIEGYAKPVTQRLNPTGRAIQMAVPLKDGSRNLGDVGIRIGTDDQVRVAAAQLGERLAGVLDAQVLSRLAAASNGKPDLALADVQALGIGLRFDSGRLELLLQQGSDQRQAGEISLATSRGSAMPANVARPADVSGYLNIYSGIDQTWGGVGTRRTGLNLELQSAVRLRGTVIENDAIYDGDVDTFVCPIEARCVYDHRPGVKRRRSRAVYDIPEGEVRVQIGDAAFAGLGPQRTPDVLGLAIEHSARKLAPGQSIVPTGQTSFRIERDSDVDVLINGVLNRRLRLKPGAYNLRDLPLGAGGNDVEVIISDDTGERRRIAFGTFIDQQMLQAGKSEWSLAGGVPSFIADDGRRYRFGETFASAYLRYGLAADLTAEAHAQGDEDVQMGGFGAIQATPWGVFGLDGSFSTSVLGAGLGAGANWTLSNYKGALFELYGARENLRLGVDYRSAEFRSPGEVLQTANGVLIPQYPYHLRLRADYSAPIGANATASLSARYQFADPGQVAHLPLSFGGDRYGIDLTVSQPFTSTLSGALTLGYSNEAYMRDLAGHNPGEPEFRVLARLHWRAGDTTVVTSSHDTLNRYSRVSGWHSEGRGVGRWETSVDAQHTRFDDRTTATGTIAYYGNRAEVRASQTASYRGANGDGLAETAGEQLSSLRLGTAIAFADGRVGVGQPIRGDAFALVHPHASLEGREVTVGTREDPRAASGTLGPALVSNLPAYASTNLPVDVADLPIGYSLGTGAFDVHPPYKGGYALEVGSSHSVTVFGTLLQADGTPAGLVSGEAVAESAPDKRVAFFTNAAGRFGAEGMAPGRWRLKLAVDDVPAAYELQIPDGAKGLYKAGTLTPVKQ